MSRVREEVAALTSTETGRVYGGVAMSERREQRRRAFVEAGLDCLARDGLPAVSVRSVCTAAGLGPRYFYESFRTLDDLLVSLVDAVAESVRDAAVAAIGARAGDMLERATASIDAGYGAILADPRRASVILLAATGHEGMQRRRRDIVLDFADAVVEFVAETGPSQAERERTKVRAIFLVGGVAELITAVLDGSLALSRAELVATAAEMWATGLAG